MHYRTAMKPLGTLALTLAALLGFAGTANAAPATTTPTATFHGGCRNWSVTITGGDDAARFDVAHFVDFPKVGPVRTVVSETLASGDIDTYSGGFSHNGRVKIAMVKKDGALFAIHVFHCGWRPTA